MTQCTVDLKAPRTDCSSSTARFKGDPKKDQGHVVLNMRGRQGVELNAQFCEPRGWVFHVADAPDSSGAGAGRSSKVRSNDAQITVWGSELFAQSSSERGSYADLRESAFLPEAGCATRRLWLEDNLTLIEEPCARIDGKSGLRLKATSDSKGPVDSVWYLGLNQTVGDPIRSGTGLEKLEICVR
jgi:hypothetical protein